MSGINLKMFRSNETSDLESPCGSLNPSRWNLTDLNLQKIHKSWGRAQQLRAIIFGWIFYGDQSSRAPRVLLHVDSPQNPGVFQNEADRHLKVLFDLCKGGSTVSVSLFFCWVKEDRWLDIRCFFRWVGKCFVVYKSIQIYANLCKTIHDILHGHNFAEYRIITLQYLHYIYR